MKKLKKNQANISPITGELIDPKLERAYFFNLIEDTLPHFRRILLFVSILFMLFIIPDLYLMTDQSKLSIIFLARIFFFLVSILFFFRIHHHPNLLYLFSTAYELIGIFIFWILLYFYQHPDIVIHQQGLILNILVIFFLIPNRFITKTMMAFLMSTGFFGIAFSRGLLFLSSYSWGLLTFSGIIIIFCALTEKRLNQLQRKQYLNTRELTRISTIDSLTGINNRMKYDQQIKKEIARAKRYQLSLSGVMFDLDNFKQINDQFGHLQGDRVLIKITQLIHHIIRENDQIFRWGGEEFIIILPNSDLRSATHMAERIREKIEQTDFSPVLQITCSFGVSLLRENDNENTFTDRLDKLQYLAKQKGKNRVMSDFVDHNLQLFDFNDLSFQTANDE